MIEAVQSPEGITATVVLALTISGVVMALYRMGSYK